MMNRQVDTQGRKPWYRHFWPWFSIALVAAAVIGGFVSLWLAASNPDSLVISEEEYQQLRSSLKAEPEQAGTAEADPRND
jgi:hypothetical protein